MTIKAALLDEQGLYLRMDELAEADLTERHVPTIKACDLPAGQYRWVPDERNPYGGAFWPMKWLTRVGLADAPLEGLALRLEKLR